MDGFSYVYICTFLPDRQQEAVAVFRVGVSNAIDVGQLCALCLLLLYFYLLFTNQMNTSNRLEQ